MKKIFSLFIFCNLFSTVLFAQEKDILGRAESWSAVLQKAAQENKLIFIDLYFTGCFPCAQMDKEVFPNQLVSKELKDNFVAVKIDVFKEKLGDTINTRFGISGYPTFLVLDQSGKLLSIFVGYNDPGLFLAELSQAKINAKDKKYYSGYSSKYNNQFPEFYLNRYKERKPIDAAEANKYIKHQKDWLAEQVALPVFSTGKLDKEIKDFVLKNANTYIDKFGPDLVIEKISQLLSEKLTATLGGKDDEQLFLQFLDEHETNFTKDYWPIIRQSLSFTFYQQVKKDTTALLRFANQFPLLYKGYMNSLYSTMVVKKQINETNLTLFCQWADKVVNEESSISVIQLAASLHKKNNNPEGYKKYLQLAITKAHKYKMPVESFQKALLQL